MRRLSIVLLLAVAVFGAQGCQRDKSCDQVEMPIAWLTDSQTTLATFPLLAANKRLIYAGKRDKRWRIYERVGTSRARALSPNDLAGHATRPALMPDGRLLFRLSPIEDPRGPGQFYVLDAEGRAQPFDGVVDPKRRDLLARPTRDGRSLVVTRYGSDLDLVELSADGSVREIATGAGYQGGGDPSPDNSQVAFSMTSEGKSLVVPKIWRRADGTLLDVGNSDGRQLAWSPDGQWIAMASYREAKRSALYVHHVSGQPVIKVTSGIYEENQPRWSPDGRHLVFEANGHADDTRRVGMVHIAPKLRACRPR